MCEFELPDVSLRCFVARQLLLQIYALSSVKFSELKLWLCKKCDKYEVCADVSLIMSRKNVSIHPFYQAHVHCNLVNGSALTYLTDW